MDWKHKLKASNDKLWGGKKKSKNIFLKGCFFFAPRKCSSFGDFTYIKKWFSLVFTTTEEDKENKIRQIRTTQESFCRTLQEYTWEKKNDMKVAHTLENRYRVASLC